MFLRSLHAESSVLEPYHPCASLTQAGVFRSHYADGMPSLIPQQDFSYVALNFFCPILFGYRNRGCALCEKAPRARANDFRSFRYPVDKTIS